MRKVLIILFALLLAAPLVAQPTRTGNIYGKVTDEEGNALPGVTVTLTGPNTGTMTAITSADGMFRLLSLYPGKEYVLKLELAGFKTKIEQGVIVNVGKNTELELKMEMGRIEEEVTVTAVSPIVDTKKTAFSTTVALEMLQSLPTARDPWVILQMTPSIQVDRENVGGNESGQQASYVALGGGSWNDTWTMDGVNITDPAAMGASPTYYDYDIFDEINVTIGGGDVDQHTGGVALNLVSRRGGNRTSFGGRFYYTEKAFESKPPSNWNWQVEGPPDPTNPDLTQWDKLQLVFGQDKGYNVIRDIKDFGFNVGGPVYKDKAWWWGSYGVQKIQTNIITGSKDDTDLNNYAFKINLQLIPDNRFEFFIHSGDKKKYGRSSTTANPSGWNQHGKYHFGSPIIKIQDEHMFGNNFFITGKYGFTDSGFGMWPANDEDLTKMRWYDVEKVLYLYSQTWFFSGRPNKQFTLHGTYFNDNLLGASHEVKAGVEYVDRRDEWVSGFPGNMRVNFDYNTRTVDWDGNGTRDIVKLLPAPWGIDLRNIAIYRGTTAGGPEGNYHLSGFLQDTISFGRFNLKLGLRYDNQRCWFKGSTYNTIFLEDTDAQYIQNYYEIQQAFLDAGVPEMIESLIPGVSIPAVTTKDTIAWNDISPRFGLTWDVTGKGKTIAKLSGAMYGGRMGSYYAYPWQRGGSGGWMQFWWADGWAGNPADKKVQLGELYWYDASTAARTAYPAFVQVGGVWQFAGNWVREENYCWGGYNYQDPGETTSPWYHYDKNWSSDKTYEIIASVEHELLPDFAVGLDLTWRRYNNWWWERPYADFFEDAEGNPGRLLDQSDYEPAPYPVPTSFIDPNTGEEIDLGDAAGRDWYVWKAGVTSVYGWYLTTTPSDYYDQYLGLDFRWNKRLSNKWMLSGSFTVQDQREYWGGYPLDPTNKWAYDGKAYAYWIGGASGKINMPVFSRWMFKAQGLYQLPYDFNVSFAFNAREGHILMKSISIEDARCPNPESYGNTICTEVFGATRLPTFWNLDMRLEKVLRVGDTGRVYLMADCFNVFNSSILNRQRDVWPGTIYLDTGDFSAYARSGEPNEVLNPRIFRFGVRFQF